MDVIREKEYELANGTKVTIVTLKANDKDSKRTCEILVDSKRNIISPEVKSISFDQEHQMFLVKDKLAIDEYLTGSIYYYINERGLPLGMCFFDILNGMYSIKFKNVEEFKSNYFNFKLNIVKQIREEVERKRSVDLENIKTMALYKKRVDESEN